MHELSIALSIIDLAESEANKAGSSEIEELELEVGLLAGVDFEALEFALEMSRQNTKLENAVIKVDKVEGKSLCKTCDKVIKIDDLYSSCPFCNGYSLELIQGNELRIKSVTVK